MSIHGSQGSQTREVANLLFLRSSLPYVKNRYLLRVSQIHERVKGENSRQWKHQQGQKSQQTRRPMDSEAVVHCMDRQLVTPNLYSDPNNVAGCVTQLNINDGI